MRLEVWIFCLLCSIGSTRTQTGPEQGPPVDISSNNTSIDSNKTEVAATTSSEGLNASQKNETKGPEAENTKPEGLTSPAPSAENTNSSADEVDKTPEVPGLTPPAPSAENTNSSADEVIKTPEVPGCRNETFSPEGTETPATATDGFDKEVNGTEGTETEPTTTASTTTSTATVPTSETASRNPKRKTRPTKPPTPSKPADDGRYGTYVDSHGCHHKVLQASGNFYTATCQAKCGNHYYNSRDNKPCLRDLRRSPRFNTRGRLCTMGFCRKGQCLGPYIGEVPCDAPTGTIYYYDDNTGNGDYYEDAYGSDYSYGYYNGHQEYRENHDYSGHGSYPNNRDYPKNGYE